MHIEVLVRTLPSSMATNSWIPSITFSGRKALMTISLCQLLNAPNSPGSVTSHGCSASSTACHASGAAARTLGRLANASTRLDIVQRRTHVDCSKAAGQAGNEASSTMPAPTRKSAHSASEISPALRLIAVAIMKEKARGQVVGRRRLLYTHEEERVEVLERELVHVSDEAEVGDGEVEDRSARCGRRVSRSRLVDLDLRLLRLLHAPLDHA
eukprot:5120032-Pleurochrysis_carterae.AAC.3